MSSQGVSRTISMRQLLVEFLQSANFPPEIGVEFLPSDPFHEPSGGRLLSVVEVDWDSLQCLKLGSNCLCRTKCASPQSLTVFDPEKVFTEVA